ncbi:MAG TPA: nitroreductase/quinone reductase family protein, partial [Acidimicrobiia bacterium]|nr:nitroreductase/quinone reductase family protein [Acidimicrobiia bacterium]
MNEFNEKIIEEFRANEGKVGGGFEGAPLLLLTTTGAKSGQPRVAPLAYLADESRIFVFGSKAGATTHPDWIHNLRADSRVTVKVETGRYDASAVELSEPDR